MIKKIALLSLLASTIIMIGLSFPVRADTTYDTSNGVGFTGKWTPPTTPPSASTPPTAVTNGPVGGTTQRVVTVNVQPLPKTGEQKSSLKFTMLGILVIAFSGVLFKESVTCNPNYKRRNL